MSIVTWPPASLPDVAGRRPRRAGREGDAKGPSTPARRRFRRRRLPLAAGLLAAILATAVAQPASGPGAAAPATGAANLVPADALAYVNLSTDPARPAVQRARSLAARFPDWPLLATAALNRFDEIVGGSISASFTTAIRPWLGNEAAFAMLPGPDGSAQSLVMLDLARPARARAFVTGAGAAPAGVYDGIRLLAYPSGTELAFLGRYLMAGPDAAVRAALDAGRDRARALADQAAYVRAASSEPSDRVLDAYLPASGVRRLLGARTGFAGALGVLLDRPSVQGTSIALSPGHDGARVLVHSVLSAPAPPSGSFTPTLQSVLPSGSALMLDVAGLDRAAPRLLRVAATAGIAGSVAPLLRRLGSGLASEGVNLRAVLSLFDRETAVAIAPGPTPALLIVARVRNEAAARNELASLEAPMSSLFSPSGSAPSQVPEIAEHQVNGATVDELQLGPGVQVDFGVWRGLVAVSTSVAAIDAVAARSGPLDAEAAYKPALSGRPDRLSSLVFADVSHLLQLAEQTGLTSGARTRQLLPDLSKIRALGLSSTSSKTDTTTKLSLEIP